MGPFDTFKKNKMSTTLKLLSALQQQQRLRWGQIMTLRTSTRLLKRDAMDLGKPTGGAKTDKVFTKRNWQLSPETNGGKRKAPKRDWSRPADMHPEKYPEESVKVHERHITRFTKSAPKKTETVAQKKERKKTEEELAALAKEEAKQRKYIEERKAKQKAKERRENQQVRDVYIPEVINVANLSRVLGVRFGKYNTVSKKGYDVTDVYIYRTSDQNHGRARYGKYLA